MSKSFARLRTTLALIALFAIAAFAQTAKHPLRIDDLQRFHEVRDPQISPDGQWIAYVVSTVDVKADRSNAHIWLSSYDGKTDRQLTYSAESSEGSPRWSPDGKFLAFTSGRPAGQGTRGNQIWLLSMGGGEAMPITEIKGRLQSFEWSPDGKRMALVIGDPDPEDTPPPAAPEAGAGAAGGAGAANRPPRAPKPIVIDRYHYKQDVQGYLLSGRHSQINLFDLATKKIERLTSGAFDESAPVWSPDGSKIAFTSNHQSDPDRDPSVQVFVADAQPHSTEKAITPVSVRGGRGRVEWSLDGKMIAFMESDERKYGAYNMEHLALVPSDGSAAPTRVAATEALDRGVSGVRFHGDSLYFFVADDRSEYPARVKVSGGTVEKLLSPPVTVSSWTTGGDHTVLLHSTDEKYTEIYAMEGASLRQITHHNDELMAELEIAHTQDITGIAKDGTEVHGLLTTPVGYVQGTKVPLLLRIHGGPNGQDQHSFSIERQFFAANGYAVLAVNYRGSSGRGTKYSRAIFADWGHYEVDDLEACLNKTISMGIADPNKLGVGGWSYGGILTDYMIASDQRFKAATSGAGTAFTVAFYGTDQYILQYDYEIGPPWEAKAWETYQKISYPFLHSDRIKTPTLFLGGERDFNVPVQGGQQMYESLKSQGLETQLIIYPNEFHGIQRPSYQKDRWERYLAWYDKHLKGSNTPSATAGGAASAGENEQ